jgi:YbbR domain-containing protein
MTRSRKKVYKKKFKKNKRTIKRSKTSKRMKLKIKNLGKKPRTYKRIQYGCSSKKNIKGGGPVFQPLTEVIRNVQASNLNTFNTIYGHDKNTNEIIQTNPVQN